MTKQSSTNIVNLAAVRAAKAAKTIKPRTTRTRVRVAGFNLPIGITMPLGQSIRRDEVRQRAAARI